MVPAFSPNISGCFVSLFGHPWLFPHIFLLCYLSNILKLSWNCGDRKSSGIPEPNAVFFWISRLTLWAEKVLLDNFQNLHQKKVLIISYSILKKIKSRIQASKQSLALFKILKQMYQETTKSFDSTEWATFERIHFRSFLYVTYTLPMLFWLVFKLFLMPFFTFWQKSSNFASRCLFWSNFFTCRSKKKTRSNQNSIFNPKPRFTCNLI